MPKLTRPLFIGLRFALAVLCFTLTPKQALAYFVHPLSAGHLAAEAGLVVRGRVVDVSRANPKRVLARLEVDEVLKGDCKGRSLTVAYDPPSMFGGVDGLVKDEYALFFLSRSGSLLVPTDEQNIKIPIRLGRLAAPGEAGDVLALVREELLFTAAGPASLSAEGQLFQRVQERMQKHQSLADLELGNSFYLLRQDAALNTIAAWQLGELPPEPRALALLRSLLGSADRDLKQAAVTALLNLKEPEALQAAVEFIDSAPKSLSKRLISMNYGGDAEMLSAIEDFHSSDPEVVAELGSMLKHPSVELRRAAIGALASLYHGPIRSDRPLHSLREAFSVPFLAQALDDEDLVVRYEAMSGLADITDNHIWRPSYNRATHNGVAPPSSPEEQKFVAHWKKWWESARAEFNATPAVPK